MLRDDFPIAHILQLKSIWDIVTWLYNILLMQVASYNCIVSLLDGSWTMAERTTSHTATQPPIRKTVVTARDVNCLAGLKYGSSTTMQVVIFAHSTTRRLRSALPLPPSAPAPVLHAAPPISGGMADASISAPCVCCPWGQWPLYHYCSCCSQCLLL